MQFIYCFLFLIYLAFLPSGGGWAVSLIWAMMILPLADALQNCLQNLTSRIAGVDNEQMTNRVMGMEAMLGFGVGAIKEQFKTPTSKNTSNSEGSGSGFKGFVSRAKSVISPNMNLSAEKDYNGNVNPIRDTLQKENNQDNYSNNNKFTPKSVAKGIVKAGYTATKTYLKTGASMVEGNFKMNNDNLKGNSYKKNFQNIEYENNISKLAISEKSDENEFNRDSKE